MISFIVFAYISSLIGNSAAACQGTTKSFKPMSDSTILVNPGKGFYTVHETYTSNYEPLSATDLKKKMENDKISLVLIEFVLDKYVSSDISQSHLDKFSKDFDAVRTAGFMCVVRFSYTQEEGNTKDALLPQLKKHISQVAEMLKKNADIILALQAGFIGTWGEWCFSKNYANVKGDTCTFTEAHMKDRNEVLRELLKTLPNSRQIQVRTPSFKQNFCGSSNLDPSKAFGTSDCARIGIHNDCFMASDDDLGTFTSGSAQRNWLKKEGLYTVVGGEPCANNYRSDCAQNKQPPAEVFNQRFTYLNKDYVETGVIKKWQNSGCYNSIANSLGYRFELLKGTFSSSAKKGGNYCASLTVNNTGVAPIYIPHNIEVILRHQATGMRTTFKQQGIDIRKWAPGTLSTFDVSFNVPTTLASGKYDVLLSLPDASSNLADKASYRILFSNSEGVQDLKDRYNKLTDVTL